MINYFNFKKFDDKYLVSNDFGNHMFLSQNDFKLLLMDKIVPENERYTEFAEKGFVYHKNKEVFVDEFKDKMKDSKNYLFSSTSLHIFVVTNMCNVQCLYCQAQSSTRHNKGMMSMETAQKAVDIALQSSSNFLSFEFQGGEPLINFDTIKFIVEYSKEKCGDKCIEYNLVSNLTLLNDDMLEYFKKNYVRISTSIDGNEFVHNKNRPYINGNGTYNDAVCKLKQVQQAGLSSGAIQTTTRYSLDQYKAIIDEYIALGMHSIFLRPLTPLGFAHDKWSEIGYSTEEFLSFYKSSIEYLIELNLKGIQCSEGHASIFLKKIINQYPVNYMELRSPCGAGIGQLAYYYDGQIFTCDEGRMFYEMGDPSFKLGTVDNSYSEIIANPVCRAVCEASLLESTPQCCDCVYQPFCGTCPILNYAFNNNIFATANDYKCGVYGGMLDVIFEIIKRNDTDEIKVLTSWI